MESKYLKCDCDVQNGEINTQEKTKFNAKDIYKSFFSVLKYSNYKVLKCSGLTFSINSLTRNIGSIITIIYFLIFLVFLIIYILKGINLLKADISKNIKEKQEIKEKIDNFKYINFKDFKYKQKIEPINKAKENIITKSKKKHLQFIIFTSPPKKTIPKFKEIDFDSKNKFQNSNNKNNNILITTKRNSLNNINNKKKNKENSNINNQIFNAIQINEKERDVLDNYELNNLEFDEAKKFDKRNFLEIYFSLLKREHLIIFTFITKDDHNIMIVKFSRFIFLLCTDMAMNVFFFSDETMHKMFLDYGKYNFIQQIPQIVYSTIISNLLEIFLCYLSMTDKHYYLIKDTKKISRNSLVGIIKYIQIKIAFYFGFTSLMFIFYWYLITCFCAVYQNTQTAFIKDSLLSFLLGNLIPFVIYLFPALFKIISLKTKIFSLECIYKFANIIPFF